MMKIIAAIKNIPSDIHSSLKLVSVRWSALATVLAGTILSNQDFLLQLIDRVAGHASRGAIVGGVMFLVFLVPSLKSEFSPVPGTVAVPIVPSPAPAGAVVLTVDQHPKEPDTLTLDQPATSGVVASPVVAVITQARDGVTTPSAATVIPVEISDTIDASGQA